MKTGPGEPGARAPGRRGQVWRDVGLCHGRTMGRPAGAGAGAPPRCGPGGEPARRFRVAPPGPNLVPAPKAAAIHQHAQQQPSGAAKNNTAGAGKLAGLGAAPASVRWRASRRAPCRQPRPTPAERGNERDPLKTIAGRQPGARLAARHRV